MSKRKVGISLITLVITIIIMIILAGVIIFTLSNSGIFDKAKDAVDRYNNKQQQIIDDLIWAENYPNGKLPGSGEEESQWVREYVDGVPIPLGFVVSPYGAHDDFLAENTKNGGLVIYALTEEEIEKGVTDILAVDSNNGELTLQEAHYESMKKRNQFVWVPVGDFVNGFVRTDFPSGTVIENESSYEPGGYWETKLDLNTNMPVDSQYRYETYESKCEVKAMYASVKKYGGFYIGRYEVGTDEEDTDKYANSDISLYITMEKYPVSFIRRSSQMGTDEGGVVALARDFYPETSNQYGAVSTLTYGVQWDTILNYWKKLNPDINLNDSTSYGIYGGTKISMDEYNGNAKYIKCEISNYNVTYAAWAPVVEKKEGTVYICTTGAYKKSQMYNIYDMAGNLAEWTMEGSSDFEYVCRGAILQYNSTSVANRAGWLYDAGSKLIGFRVALYVK